MTTQSLLHSLFRYKASADDELLEALASASDRIDPERFASALRVLHHAHIVDRIFAAHLQGIPHPYIASWIKEAPALADLSAAMKQTDQWYLDHLSTIDPTSLETMVDFTFTDGSKGRMSHEEMLGHVVTHSGYHRGDTGRLLPEIEETAMRDIFAGYLHRSEPQRRERIALSA